MKSGLEGRNNWQVAGIILGNALRVSMKSGLEGRNNCESRNSKRT